MCYEDGNNSFLRSERVTKALRKYRVKSIICTLGFVPTFVAAEDRRMAQAIDNKGVCALIQAAESAGLPGRFVLVSSLLASGKTDNLSSQLLNSLGGVVDAKHASETALASSSLDWTILRPGASERTILCALPLARLALAHLLLSLSLSNLSVSLLVEPLRLPPRRTEDNCV